MSAEQVISLLWQTHLGLSAGLLAVALLRRPLRRLVGAEEAYAVWLLPLLGMGCGALPDAGLPRLKLEPVVWQAALAPLEQARQAGVGLLSGPLPWLLGAALLLGWQWLRHVRFVRLLPTDATGCLRTPRGSSPGLLGVWRPRLLLPMDFEERFSAQERRWILAHEALHARRQDNAARLLAALLQALAWFNPLLWWALPALRHDQELACDAALLSEHPDQWRGYAKALLKADPQFAVPIAASAWQPTHPLKERIDMLKFCSPLPRWRRHLGRLGLCAAAMLAAGAVQALKTDSAPARRALTAGMMCHAMGKPQVPDTGMRGHFELTAIFEVNAKGEPFNIRVAGEPAFKTAVSEAIGRYGCKPTPGGLEVVQNFVFRLD